MKNGDLWTLQEVAHYLRVSRTSVYSWAQQGKIPAGKVGKQWRFSKREITRWWMAHRHSDSLGTPTSPRERPRAAALTS